MKLAHESDTLADGLCFDVGDHAPIFGTNRRGEPFRIKFAGHLWDVMSLASCHVQILPQSLLIRDLCRGRDHLKDRVRDNPIFSGSITKTLI